eukprot:CAMPEP_0206532094 /NCGR_PEP_ID=MMETSP0325_2-20121206/4155_1 /ASSEMBLY_ACC=CAM_ASM_000347 /TAXON_ID=2866 /ORGANISM="Crypthecodinium cohnii, Strain Seligo" /LENGTH=531 /DNA_ID=CAMNT_0054028461 /DNA_START=45 /DNA_END=1636 /DNA_ORIENTATION=-
MNSPLQSTSSSARNHARANIGTTGDALPLLEWKRQLSSEKTAHRRRGRRPLAWKRLASVAVALSSLSVDTVQAACEEAGWRHLHDILTKAYLQTDYENEFLQDVAGLADQAPGMAWFKDNYQDCVEGFLSLILYYSIHNKGRQAALLDLASSAARELNPLALQSGLSTWPLFGLLDKLQLFWQAGQRVAPLATEPWRKASCPEPAPGLVSPLLSAVAAGTQGGVSPFSLVRGLRPGALVIDAGVFDGTDWSLFSVARGLTVIGFEPLETNRRLVDERFPEALLQLRPGSLYLPDGRPCRRHTLLPIVPGEPMPREPWAEVFASSGGGGSSSSSSLPACPIVAPTENEEGLGHTYIIGAALGERVRGLNMTTRYDYSSVADQGYLKGPKDMKKEEVGMTSLDEIFGRYLAASGRAPAHAIDVLKLDVEGYEMGALRGAEQLLAEGRVHYLILEFHPGMLGSTGTNPLGMLNFLRHYCFLCHSLKIDRPFTLEEFVARYTESVDVLPVQGLGAIEDLVCQNLAYRPPSHPLSP